MYNIHTIYANVWYVYLHNICYDWDAMFRRRRRPPYCSVRLYIAFLFWKRIFQSQIAKMVVFYGPTLPKHAKNVFLPDNAHKTRKKGHFLMVTPRGRKTRFKSQMAKVVFGHLFLSTKNRSEIVSISSRCMFHSLIDYAHKVAIYSFAHFCANCFGSFRPFWSVFRHFVTIKSTFWL
jgi:hypothetical protein